MAIPEQRHLWQHKQRNVPGRSLSNLSSLSDNGSIDPDTMESDANRNVQIPPQAVGGRRNSIEDNTQVDEVRTASHENDLNKRSLKQINGMASLRRQHTSLYCIQKELKNLGRRINQHLDAMAVAENLHKAALGSHDPMFEPPSDAPGKPPDGGGPACASQGDLGANKGTEQSKGQSRGHDNQGSGSEPDAGVYAAKLQGLQEGDGNLMVVCEPTSAVNTTVCRQVGNNNVMINLKMVSNRCQIINEEGKVMPLDSPGEFWLEIRKRGQGSDSDPSSSRSSGSSDYNPEPGAPPASVPTVPATPCPVYKYDGPDTVRLPQEYSFNSSVDSNSLGESRISASYVEPRWPIDAFRTRGPEENYDSCNTLVNGDDESIYENIQVDEKKGSIMMKIEASSGGRSLTEFEHLEDCEPVQKALGHQKVIDFLKAHAQQEGICNLEMSVIGWEYEREELYSTVNRENEDQHEDIYSTPEQRLVRKPTLPPRAFKLRHHRSGGGHGDKHHSVGTGGAGPHGVAVRREPTESDDPYEIKVPDNSYSSRDKDDLKAAPSLPIRKMRDENSALHPKIVINGESKTQNSSLPKPPNQAESHPKLSRNTPLPPPPKVPASPRQQRKTGQGLCAPWYHGNISGECVKKLMKGKRDGSFLVRDTEGQHKYTLEFMDCTSTRRLKIWLTDNRYHLERGASTRFKEFDSVEELIEAAMKSGIEVRDSKAETWKVVRISPIDREREKPKQLNINIYA